MRGSRLTLGTYSERDGAREETEASVILVTHPRVTSLNAGRQVPA